MSEEIHLPELKPRRRRRLMLVSLTGLLAGLGLFGHQAGFVVWQMEPMDLGFTQVAQAGVLHGNAPDTGMPDFDEGAASELLRPGRPEEEKIMMAERPAAPELIEKNRLPRGIVQAKRNGLPLPKLAGDDERDLREAVDVKDHAVDLCPPGQAGCGDLDADDKHLDDDLEELTVLAALEEIPDIDDDKDDHDKPDREEDCDDDRESSYDRDHDRDDDDKDRDRDRDGHRGGHHD
jgi:hypothetical protein